MKKLLCFLLCVLPVAAYAAFFSPCCYNIGITGWHPLKVGAGGQLTGGWIGQDSPATRYARSDSGGAFWYNTAAAYCGNTYGGQPASGCWQQLVTRNGITSGATLAALATAGGVYDIAGAASAPADVYMIYAGYLLSSTNNGQAWTTASGWTALTNAYPNAQYALKTSSKHLAVDTVDPTTVMVGTPSNGVFKCTSSGGTCTAVSSIPPATGQSSLDTSTSSVSTGTGSKTFTLAGTCSTVAGSGPLFQVYETSNPANAMQGTQSCTGSTMTLTVTTAWGSGSHSDWTVFDADAVPGQSLVAYDPTSSTSGGYTHGVFACSWGSGVYESTDGGSTWGQAASGPTQCYKMVVSRLGEIWVISNYNLGTDKQLWKYTCGSPPCGSSGTWANIDLTSVGGYTLNSVTPDTRSGHCSSLSVCDVYAQSDSGTNYVYSSDDGTTWHNAYSCGVTKSAQDIPWLAEEGYYQNGDQQMDATGLIGFFEGVGFWTYTPTQSCGTVTLVSLSAGIEQLVAQSVNGTPNGPIVTAQDRPVFGKLTTGVFPSQSWPTGVGPPGTNGYTLDWASFATSTMLSSATGNGSSPGNTSVTSNGGTSWANWTSTPTGWSTTQSFASVTATDANHWLVGISTDGNLYCTANAGTSFTAQTVGSVPSGEGWMVTQYYALRNYVAADRVQTQAFAAYNSGATAPGLYMTKDNCATWHQITSGHLTSFDQFDGKLAFAPAACGNCSGVSAGDAFISFEAADNSPFYECQITYGSNSGSCSNVSTVASIVSWGYGAAKPGGSGFPAIYCICTVSGVAGIWQSDDHAVTWTQISYPSTLTNIPLNCIDGDYSVYGRMYVCNGGAGWLQYNYLFNRDLDPAANDNSPAFLNRAA